MKIEPRRFAVAPECVGFVLTWLAGSSSSYVFLSQTFLKTWGSPKLCRISATDSRVHLRAAPPAVERATCLRLGEESKRASRPLDFTTLL